ncbi:MAG: putative OB-fold protein [Gammaproteobacteria bacterium]|jgi:uncharacterized OB-fold protein
MNDASAFPYPIAEYGTEPYWQACNEERLVMQRCDTCSKFRWHPAPLCTHCGADGFSWQALSGRGKITTWTVVTHPVHPAAFEKVPYVVVEVELEEQAGLRMLSNLVDVTDDDISFDAKVMVEYVQHSDDQKLPVFRLVTN